ncbi:MAG TPA: EthD family reductase [Pseudonocardiaceae bacterium]|nr:EthD family reductase [Pseudonocardiaceae bacterium]
MTEAEFQRYWVEVHAVRYASKIPQALRYLVNTRIALPGESGDPLWCGVGEFWFESEKERIESLRSKEYLQGAVPDEPNWSASWRGLTLNTTDHTIRGGPEETRDNGMAKLLVLSTRREGLPLDRFCSYCLDTHAVKVLELPGLRRYRQGHVQDGAYAVAEAALDCVEQLWFDSVDAALAAQNSVQQDMVRADYRLFAEGRYVHTMLLREHWIIGPQPRAYDDQRNRIRINREESVSQESFLEFLSAAHASDAVLARYNHRNLGEVLFRAKNEGFDFTADEAADVIGKLEANVILTKDRDPIDGSSRLWRQMFGRRYLEYLVTRVVDRHTDEELRSLIAPRGQEVG